MLANDTNVDTQNSDLSELIHPFCTYQRKLNLTGTHKGQKNAFKYLCRMASATQAFGCMDTTHEYEAGKHNTSSKTISNWDAKLKSFGLITTTRTGRGSERRVTQKGFDFILWALDKIEFSGYHKPKEVLISSCKSQSKKSCSDRSSDRTPPNPSPILYTDTDISKNEKNNKLESGKPVDNRAASYLSSIFASLQPYNLSEIDKLSFKRFLINHDVSLGELSYAWDTFIAYSRDNAVMKPLGLLVKYLKRNIEFGLIFEALTEEIIH